MSDLNLDDQRGGKMGRRRGWRDTKSKTERERFLLSYIAV